MIVAATGNDKQVYYRKFDPLHNTWSNWDSLGGIAASEPVVGIIGTKNFIFIKGSDYALWYKLFDSTTNQWSSWASLGGKIINNIDTQTVSTPSSNLLYVFVEGSYNTIYYMVYNNDSNTWSNFQSIGMPTTATQTPNYSVSITSNDFGNAPPFCGIWYMLFPRDSLNPPLIINNGNILQLNFEVDHDWDYQGPMLIYPRITNYSTTDSTNSQGRFDTYLNNSLISSDVIGIPKGWGSIYYPKVIINIPGTNTIKMQYFGEKPLQLNSWELAGVINPT